MDLGFSDRYVFFEEGFDSLGSYASLSPLSPLSPALPLQKDLSVEQPSAPAQRLSDRVSGLTDVIDFPPQPPQPPLPPQLPPSVFPLPVTESWENPGAISQKTTPLTPQKKKKNKTERVAEAILANPHWVTTRSRVKVAKELDVSTTVVYEAFQRVKRNHPELDLPDRWGGSNSRWRKWIWFKGSK